MKFLEVLASASPNIDKKNSIILPAYTLTEILLDWIKAVVHPGQFAALSPSHVITESNTHFWTL